LVVVGHHADASRRRVLRVRIDVRAALHVLRVSSVTMETHFTRARVRRPAFFV
jgi:hypothetical protein